MNVSGLFIIDSIFLGVGLAADAFSVSVVNGLSEPDPHPGKAVKIASVFALFQALMPMLGWSLAHTMLHAISWLQRVIPWLSMGLLVFLGFRMIRCSLRRTDPADCPAAVTGMGLLAQGIATSLDALSVGIVIAPYPFGQALTCSVIIAAVTFLICWVGVLLGRTIGTRLAGKAEILGGSVLILIGLEIFIRGL